MLGGGIWHADAQPLALLRRAVSRKPGRLKKILATEGIARDLLSIQGDINEQIAVDAFLSQNSDDALKTAPKVSNLNPYDFLYSLLPTSTKKL